LNASAAAKVVTVVTRLRLGISPVKSVGFGVFDCQIDSARPSSL
jgi:hypothetical protein